MQHFVPGAGNALAKEIKIISYHVELMFYKGT
jgi:hypothetical protein